MAESSVPVVSPTPASPAPAARPARRIKPGSISVIQGLLLVIVGSGSFAAAFMAPKAGPLIVLFLFCVARLCRQATPARALVLGLLLGILAYIPQAFYAAGGMGPGVTLTMVAWPLGVAVVAWIGHLAWRRGAAGLGLLILPFLWVGLEYVLTEVCPPQWGWLDAGVAMPAEALHHLVGVYGLAFILMLIAAITAGVRGLPGFIAMLVAIGASWGLSLWQLPASGAAAVAASAAASAPAGGGLPTVVTVPGHFTARTISAALAEAVKEHPESAIVVLPDYSLSRNDPVVRWAQNQKKFVVTATREGDRHSGRATDILVVTDSRGDTALVVNRQLGAGPPEDAEPDLADTPWGKIALMPFHDLARRWDTDRSVKAGAKAFIVLNPDAEPGNIQMREERTHLAEVRAAEYGVPVVRASTSGVCQLITSRGVVKESVEAGAPLAGTLDMAGDAGIPLGGLLAPVCLGIAVVYILVELVLIALADRRAKAVGRSGSSAMPPAAPPPPPPPSPPAAV
ncbi:MAG TPA: hypothetical protein VH253_19730 [Phycisphaerae bacterium]|nr:hypothetical protein [Phycisphaerae bacterium]